MTTTRIICSNFDDIYLDNLIFISDFTLQNKKVIPINIQSKPNLDLFKSFNLNQQEEIFEKVFESWEKISREGVVISEFDLWFIVFSENNISVELVDLDFIFLNSENPIFKYSNEDLLEFISYFPKESKELFLTLLKNEKYEHIQFLYDFHTIFK